MPSSRYLPDPGIVPTSLMFPVLAGGLFTSSTMFEALLSLYHLTDNLLYIILLELNLFEEIYYYFLLLVVSEC